MNINIVPEISIIVPVYNVGLYLQQSLNSLIYQTFKNIEIICINDCSIDNSLSILQDYAKNDSRIKIINLEQNAGQGRARNIAIDIAQGEYIMFLDPDDWLELDACEFAYNKIRENDNDFVVFDFSYFYEDTQEIKENHSLSNIFKAYPNKEKINPQTCEKNYFLNAFAWNKIYKKSFMDQFNIKFSDSRFAEDSQFFVKVMANATSFSIIEETLYNYRKKNSADMVFDYFKYYKLLVKNHKENFDFICQKGNENLKRNYLIYAIKSVLICFGKIKLLSKDIKREYYTEMNNFFVYLNKNNDIFSIKESIDYKHFNLIIKHPIFATYEKKLLKKKIRELIFSIKNKEKGKTITFLGLKLVLRRNENEECN